MQVFVRVLCGGKLRRFYKTNGDDNGILGNGFRREGVDPGSHSTNTCREHFTGDLVPLLFRWRRHLRGFCGLRTRPDCTGSFRNGERPQRGWTVDGEESEEHGSSNADIDSHPNDLGFVAKSHPGYT